MRIARSDEKDAILRQQYGFGFDRVVAALSTERFLDERVHPKPVRSDGWVWVGDIAKKREMLKQAALRILDDTTCQQISISEHDLARLKTKAAKEACTIAV